MINRKYVRGLGYELIDVTTLDDGEDPYAISPGTDLLLKLAERYFAQARLFQYLLVALLAGVVLWWMPK